MKTRCGCSVFSFGNGELRTPGFVKDKTSAEFGEVNEAKKCLHFFANEQRSNL
jgi:hypothetical protein